VIHLYIFCSKLEKYFGDTTILELEQWTAPSETTVKKVQWRSSNQSRKRRRTEAEDSIGDDNGSRGGNGGTANVDGLEVVYDDWSTQIMKWRDEASEGAKEARAISGKGDFRQGRDSKCGSFEATR
jgi:hypothetical protein